MLKFMENRLGRKKVAKEIEASYDDWSDPAFVAAIHERRLDEIEAGVPRNKQTKCFCISCCNTTRPKHRYLLHKKPCTYNEYAQYLVTDKYGSRKLIYEDELVDYLSHLRNKE